MNTLAKTSTQVILELQNQINEDPRFAELLILSLTDANNQAKKDLSPELYDALNQLYSGGGWPVLPAGYINYLTLFAATRFWKSA